VIHSPEDVLRKVIRMAAPTVIRTGQRFPVAGMYMSDCPKKGRKTFARHFVAPTCSCCRKTVSWRLLFASEEQTPAPANRTEEQASEEQSSHEA